MSRNVPFEPDLPCDVCGRKGGWDFMGDIICGYCLEGVLPDEEKEDEDE